MQKVNLLSPVHTELYSSGKRNDELARVEQSEELVQNTYSDKGFGDPVVRPSAALGWSEALETKTIVCLPTDVGNGEDVASFYLAVLSISEDVTEKQNEYITALLVCFHIRRIISTANNRSI
ncbi:hypothetical protein RHGRI_000287 [Rhododendron griersonianum]|uniref:Uncharacterized protein n=1 Tax=Rhododendron griersonianum TaxID=479676 RepID=A0AAV6LH63_9ERIC|nr:hypothetical protein RHGRI_000287 [Rhododendron griersonianum]